MAFSADVAHLPGPAKSIESNHWIDPIHYFMEEYHGSVVIQHLVFLPHLQHAHGIFSRWHQLAQVRCKVEGQPSVWVIVRVWLIGLFPRVPVMSVCQYAIPVPPPVKQKLVPTHCREDSVIEEFVGHLEGRFAILVDKSKHLHLFVPFALL